MAIDCRPPVSAFRVVTNSAGDCCDVSTLMLGSTKARLTYGNVQGGSTIGPVRPYRKSLIALKHLQRKQRGSVFGDTRPDLSCWLQLSTSCAVVISPSTHEANSAGPASLARELLKVPPMFAASGTPRQETVHRCCQPDRGVCHGCARGFLARPSCPMARSTVWSSDHIHVRLG